MVYSVPTREGMKIMGSLAVLQSPGAITINERTGFLIATIIRRYATKYYDRTM
jgi:hypothetical protein